jgi:hypothetical protein
VAPVGFLLVLLLRVGGSLMNGWMWRPIEAQAIYQGAPRSKGGANQARNRLGRPAWASRPRPVFDSVRPDLPPRCFSRFLEFMPNFLWSLDVFSRGLDKGTWRANSRIFCLGPQSFTCFGPWVVWSHVHRVS